MMRGFLYSLHIDNIGLLLPDLASPVKKAIWYVLGFVGFVGLVAVGTILYLDYAVDQIELKRLEI